MHMGALVYSKHGGAYDLCGGAYAGTICGPGWPGNFPAHHVKMHFVKKSLKRTASTQNMKQAPHKSYPQSKESKHEPTVTKNAHKR